MPSYKIKAEQLVARLKPQVPDTPTIQQEPPLRFVPEKAPVAQPPKDEPAEKQEPVVSERVIDKLAAKSEPSATERVIDKLTAKTEPPAEEQRVEKPKVKPEPSVAQRIAEKLRETPEPSVTEKVTEKPKVEPEPSVAKRIADKLREAPEPSVTERLAETPAEIPAEIPKPLILEPKEDFETKKPQPVIEKQVAEEPKEKPKPFIFEPTEDFETFEPKEVFETLKPQPVIEKQVTEEPKEKPKPFIFEPTEDFETFEPKEVFETLKPQPVIEKQVAEEPTEKPKPPSADATAPIMKLAFVPKEEDSQAPEKPLVFTPEPQIKPEPLITFEPLIKPEPPKKSRLQEPLTSTEPTKEDILQELLTPTEPTKKPRLQEPPETKTDSKKLSLPRPARRRPERTPDAPPIKLPSMSESLSDEDELLETIPEDEFTATELPILETEDELEGDMFEPGSASEVSIPHKRRWPIPIAIVLAAIIIGGAITYLVLSSQANQREENRRIGYELLDEAIALIQESDVVVVTLDAAILSEVTQDNLNERRILLERVPPTLETLGSAEDQAREAIKLFTSDEDKELAQHVINAAVNKIDMLTSGEVIMTMDIAAMSSAIFFGEAWTIIVGSDAELRASAELSRTGGYYALQEAIARNNTVLENLARASDLLTQAQAVFAEADYSTVFNYLELKIESIQLAIAADQAVLDGNLDLVNIKNAEFELKDAAVVNAANQIPLEPLTLITEAYDEAIAQAHAKYNSARANAVEADWFIREYVGVETQTEVQ